MKKKLRCTAAALLAAIAAFGGNFAFAAADTIYPDVELDDPCLEAVTALYDMGIMEGDELGNFNPDNNISREEFAAVICRMLGMDEEARAITDTAFTDVAEGHWSCGYVALAAQLGIVSGYGNGIFKPQNPVTVQEAAKMLVCAWGYGDDAVAAGDWPDGYISVARELGIMEHIPAGSETQAASRASVARMTFAMIDTPTWDETLGGMGSEE